MTQAVTLYHNPRCSKSRQALELLTEKGAEVTVVRYLDQPLTASAVKRLIGQLGISPHELLRTQEAPYRELGLTPKSSADAICRAVAEHPVLMERPIAVVGERAVIGRPPEQVLELL
ncbi:MAG: arsenate reductase (glutaredoxin) [Polyangiaceae bacterium]|nr:arsenate reductase (glutaredoxin) [Polyangiaceae bacterium]MCW5790425.1 arsenate reductase (glutaredoxin) [Polyangiaceae bacterium]